MKNWNLKFKKKTVSFTFATNKEMFRCISIKICVRYMLEKQQNTDDGNQGRAK